MLLMVLMPRHLFFFYMYLVITLFVLHQSLPGDSQDEEDEAKLLTVS